jgi:hypothetical protein
LSFSFFFSWATIAHRCPLVGRRGLGRVRFRTEPRFDDGRVEQRILAVYLLLRSSTSESAELLRLVVAFLAHYRPRGRREDSTSM